VIASAATGVSVLCAAAQFLGSSGRHVRSLLIADGLNAVPMALFAILAFLSIVLSPRQDAAPRSLAGMLVTTSGTLAAYAADNLILFFVAWVVSMLPFLLSSADRAAPHGTRTPAQDSAGRARLPGIVLVGSALALLAAVILIELTVTGAADPWSMTGLAASEWQGSRWLFALLMLAVFLRKGMFPLHSWVPASFAGGPLIPAGLLFNGHLGAFLLARMVVPLTPEIARELFPILSTLALITAAYAALLAVSERRPRRLLGLLAVSQASCILAGLESAKPEAVSGALIQWLVVGAGTTGLIAVYRLIETRYGGNLEGREFLGLAERFPRLAVSFAVCGLAIVGLPGTLGFCAEDLLLHGLLESNSWIGLAQPLATALNAITMVRLFARLFMGRRHGDALALPDALPRERWALAALVAFLVIGGLAPRMFVSVDSVATTYLTQTVSGGEAGSGQ
jgi:NADH-quinone oxidoreductase subunit M